MKFRNNIFPFLARIYTLTLSWCANKLKFDLYIIINSEKLCLFSNLARTWFSFFLSASSANPFHEFYLEKFF